MSDSVSGTGTGVYIKEQFVWSPIKSYGKQLACEPFRPEDRAPAPTRGTGFAVPVQKVGLVPLKVVYGNMSIPTGATIWLPGDRYVMPWAKAQYEIEGKMVIMVPESEVLIYKAQ